ncbi:hypothetical protein VTJ04DRAFT_7089 [Mycothermus thermophilus]|uniref:uncharacterized protein n=1 Tax=Humicola insolens TaxID=85995 RepID=UPI003741F61E
MANHLPPGLSPDAFDAVTELTSIVIRLRASQQQDSTTAGGQPSATTAPPGGAAAAGTTTNTSSTPAPLGVTGTTPSATTNTGQPQTSTIPGPTNTGTPTPTSTALPPLSLKDLPAATDPLRHKLQRARAAVRALADVQRGLAQQEAELASLEARRRAQAERLAKAQEDGLLFVRAEGEKGERMVEGE